MSSLSPITLPLSQKNKNSLQSKTHDSVLITNEKKNWLNKTFGENYF